MSVGDRKTNNGKHTLYDRDWKRFQDADAIELRFVGRSPEAQRRLNAFTLWALGQPELVQLDGKDVLEFGAGHGRLATEFPVFRSYVGAEYSQNLVRLGEDRLERAGLADRARLTACDCMDYDGPEAGFDVVCSLGMFEYVSDPESVLRKMVYHLRPGGRLFIDVMNSSPLYNAIYRFRSRTGLKKGGERVVFSSRDLRRLFRTVGLEDVQGVMREYPILDTLYADWGLNWPLTLRNRLARTSWLNVFGTVCFAFGTKPARG